LKLKVKVKGDYGRGEGGISHRFHMIYIISTQGSPISTLQILLKISVELDFPLLVGLNSRLPEINK